MFVLDSHCDTPSQLLRLRDLCLDNPRAQVDFPKLARGGVDASFFALYIPKEMDSEQAYDHARKMLFATRDAVFAGHEYARFAIGAAEALENKRKGFISIFLGLENASPIAYDWNRLDWFHRQGIRYITLCHNADNQVCDSAAQGSTHHGLSSFGREMISRMNDMGIIIDCAHISDESFWDVIRYSSKPVVSTHSCARALCNHPRNMSDDMIKALADKGGVIQVNFYPVFLDRSFADVLDSPQVCWYEKAEADFIENPEDPAAIARWNEAYDMLLSLKRPSYKLVADHIDHIVNLVGVDHVGIGSDFDGIAVPPQGLDDVSCMPLIFDELRARGYAQEDIEKIAGGNFLRVMRLCGAA